MTKSSTASHQQVITACALANDMRVELVEMSHLRMDEKQIKKWAQRAVAAMRAMLNTFGQLMPILVSPEGIIIAGHETYLAAKEEGLKHLKVVRANGISDDERRAITIGLARLPEISPWDLEILKVEVEELQKLDLNFDLDAITILNTAEQDVLVNPGSKSAALTPDAADLCPALPTAADTVTRIGDVWNLGKSRILQGDAMQTSSYALLLGEKRAQLLLSDPPFNLVIAGHVSGLGKVKHDNFAMGVGEFTPAEFTEFLKTFLINSSAYLKDGALAYSFMDRRHLVELSRAAAEADYSLYDLAIWNKLSGGMGGLYRSQFEPCFVFKWGNAPIMNNVQLGKFGRNRTNVWDHPGLSRFGKGRDEALRDHPTVKPVALLAEIIKDVSRRGDIVLDPFAGSGSTIIAAERTGRIGFGIELDPKYVDVVVRRWETFTGLQATHAESGKTFAEMREERLTPPAPSVSTAQPVVQSVKLRQRPVAAGKAVNHA